MDFLSRLENLTFCASQLQQQQQVTILFVVILSQNLYVSCVRLVPEILHEVNDLMTEKEIRLRLPLEELDLLMSASLLITTT